MKLKPLSLILAAALVCVAASAFPETAMLDSPNNQLRLTLDVAATPGQNAGTPGEPQSAQTVTYTGKPAVVKF